MLYIFATTQVVAVDSRAWGSMVWGSAAKPMVKVRSSTACAPLPEPEDCALPCEGEPQEVSRMDSAIVPARSIDNFFFIRFSSFLILSKQLHCFNTETVPP